MEEINTAPPSSNESNSGQEKQESLIDKFNKPISRRNFLKGAGLVGAAALLSSCAPGILEAGNEEDSFEGNIRELNRQFDLVEDRFVRPDGFFDYARFEQQYPGFENYRGYIEESAIDFSRRYGVSPNVLRALGSGIVASNMNNQDPIQEGDQFRQRFGVMQVFPIHLIENERIKNDPEFPKNIKDLAEPKTNIKYGMQYLVEGLRDVKNNGENKDMIKLTLAQYYGKDSLCNQIKQNREITEENYLWQNYVKYRNTVNVLGISTEGIKSNETIGLEGVWHNALQNWPESRLAQNKEVFFKEADKYFNDVHNEKLGLTKDQYLAMFVAIAITESHGGLYLVNEHSNALGWYQLIPKWRHLEDFNELHGTNYTYDQLIDNRFDAISIEVGIWTLMRYRDHMNAKELMMMFKGGHNFGQYEDDYKWWNSVSQKMDMLLGNDELAMGIY
jgi:hypothetical protein